MKEFVVYTALRVLLFAATLAIVMGIWSAFGHAHLLVSIVVAFVLSGIGSWFVLARPRNAFARNVEARAERATAAFEAMRAKEDDDQAVDPTVDQAVDPALDPAVDPATQQMDAPRS